MKELHILFTAVGRRIELLQAFRQAALILNIDLKIYGADMVKTAPALAYCDSVRIVCSMKDGEYISQIKKVCLEDRIDMVIPTIDTDLMIMSQNIEEFEKIGTKILISKKDKIMLCRDKTYTADFFKKCGLFAPDIYNDYKEYSGSYPCFIKPKNGSSSINAFEVKSKDELQIYSKKIKNYVIQPFIEGTEYTIDIFCDFEGNPIYITPRIRNAVRSGEVLKTEIVLDKKIIDEALTLIKEFKPCGPITVQLIREKDTNIDYYIEINPRYGGGVPLSMKAGAKSAEAVLNLLSGKKVFYQSDVCNNRTVYSRFDQSVCIDQGIDNQQVKGVIFDLDDTLYSETEYIKSGFKAISDYLMDSTIEEKLIDAYMEGKDAIDTVLDDMKMVNKKEQCLHIYRHHKPEITLYKGIKQLIEDLKKRNIKIGIITDGRIEGQRNKIAALGLDRLIGDIIITDELGGIQFRKPNDISFRIMQNRWRISFEQIMYVGDNIEKDFLAPKQLGMKTIWFNNKEGLYTVASEKSEKNVDFIKRLRKMLIK